MPDNDEIDCEDDMKHRTAYRPGQESERAKHPKGVPWCPDCRAHVSPVKVAGLNGKDKAVPCLACYIRSGQAKRDSATRRARLEAAAKKRRTTKTKARQIPCNKCGKLFPEQGRKSQCLACQKATTKRLLTFVEPIQWHTCEKCGRQWKGKGVLCTWCRPQRKLPKQRKRFTCEKCKRRFTPKGDTLLCPKCEKAREKS